MVTQLSKKFPKTGVYMKVHTQLHQTTKEHKNWKLGTKINFRATMLTVTETNINL
jgi:hypothetical protein